jgi:hypothetical protein
MPDLQGLKPARLRNMRKELHFLVQTLLTMTAIAGSAGGAGAAGGCRAIAVATGRATYAHATSIQAAVDEAHPCDWIVVAPGVYRGSVTIRTPDLVLRGIDRNTVVVDGAHEHGNGITIEADDVSIENLTVRNFDRGSRNDDGTGIEVLWRRVHGWRGSYLTAYDDGLRGGYGFWASGSVAGELANIYASGFSDSGLYVGACRDCRALVTHAVAEHDLIGLAATNAGGHFVVEGSTFRWNAVGISLNSSESDPPPPQLGLCPGEARSTETTRLARCTVVRDDRLVANNALDVPSESASVRPGSGIGIDLLGADGDLITGDVIAGNVNVGVLGLQLPERGRPRFPLAGNRVSGNRIVGSRFAIALAGGAGSVGNCFEANGPGATIPSARSAFGCENVTTPTLRGAAVVALVERLHNQLAVEQPRPQPEPGPQATMPAPCTGVPATPLCRR